MNARRVDRIFLTGFMGCGKSTVAPALAGILGFGCIDLDTEVERRTGETVSRIFALDGEAYFRGVEREVLFETGTRRSIVVALGGGTVANEENCTFVKSAGLLVYLQVDSETLFARLRRKEDRPLLSPRGGPGSDDVWFRETMSRLFLEREPFYRRADVTIMPDPDDPERTAARIADSIRRLSPRSLT
ncbi:MAG TPA: shikimate kinase [Bacteroidota bacterium]|nr:shikimate kinase [Bacteroidota bacterium]